MAKVSIRKGDIADLNNIMDIYDKAREFMRENGNHTQWTDGYPSRDIVMADIEAGNNYVGIDRDGDIVLVFAFIIGEDPTYTYIEDGEWPDNSPYGTIHRIASSGKLKGMLDTCVDFCRDNISALRLDTHADNTPMRSAAERLGFVRCGIIYCRDGSPRIAYQLR